MNLLLFPAVMEYQVQINGVKAKLQETRARKKQQEELIMKVENQALKVSNEHMHICSVFLHSQSSHTQIVGVHLQEHMQVHP